MKFDASSIEELEKTFEEDIMSEDEQKTIQQQALERLAQLDGQAEDYGELRMVQLFPEDVELFKQAIEQGTQA